MQKLLLDPSWDKALSAKDREEIHTLFENTIDSNEQFSLFWTAVNYKEELLITVLIHNFTDHTIDFANAELQYKEGGQLIAHHRFNLPNVKLNAAESTVWTFIFPLNSRKSLERPERGILSFIE